MTLKFLSFPSLILFFLQTLWYTVNAQVPFFNPASIPLAVRSPYLNTWIIDTESSQPLSNAWPTFWTQTVCRL